MRKELYKKIEIPQGIEAEVEGNMLKVKGSEGEISKKFNIKNLEFGIKDGKIIVGNKKSTKKEKKMMNTVAAHIKNMIRGVQGKFEYELVAVFSHFPISVEVKGHEVLIKNFLGEKIPRKTSVPAGVEIEVKGNLIKIRSADRELAGQAAANLETATRIRSRDRRIFQDGIFMTKKAGREI
ncbi:MAG TPA: 50S ribosomal protein L6 [Candidatus Nanoarchaeia archaeon]|uniref:50S ribosomal protein L6 n=1 Tax=uncultured archaeon Rifle_16ft_4_minimus_37913 TaxID=1665152 RepID=A0A0H4T913_9ARCH|nr:50S ribosomal protein L6, large subunit ribosomal protein L6 [uncultured archaeon Rifle_16ft_4_minimus_37913]HKZ33995.1 50S ribosomal protein L6 [Candidatus Nanoarchaeia archaeon]